MNLETKPTLQDLGIICEITPNGISKLDDTPMCAWKVRFQRGSHSETFDYFTGSGCGELWPADLGKFPSIARLLSERESLVFNVRPQQRWQIKDKALLCSIAHKINAFYKWKPDPIEVLWSIARDGEALEMTFDDFASEFGYDPDSRKAEKIYRTCQDNAIRLKKILSREQIETIKALEL